MITVALLGRPQLRASPDLPYGVTGRSARFRSLRLAVCLVGFAWLPAEHVTVWLPLTPSGCLWLPLAAPGCFWLPGGLAAWLPMAASGCLASSLLGCPDWLASQPMHISDSSHLSNKEGLISIMCFKS